MDLHKDKKHYNTVFFASAWLHQQSRLTYLMLTKNARSLEKGRYQLYICEPPPTGLSEIVQAPHLRLSIIFAPFDQLD